MRRLLAGLAVLLLVGAGLELRVSHAHTLGGEADLCFSCELGKNPASVTAPPDDGSQALVVERSVDGDRRDATGAAPPLSLAPKTSPPPV